MKDDTIHKLADQLGGSIEEYEKAIQMADDKKDQCPLHKDLKELLTQNYIKFLKKEIDELKHKLKGVK